MEIDDVTGVIVDAAVKIHRDLGSRLFESVYEVTLAALLERRGLHVVRQHPIGFTYEGIEFTHGFRADLVVERCVLVELKVTDRLTSTQRTQLLTYLRLGGFRVGLVLNFGAEAMKDGIKRVVNDHLPSAFSPLRVNRPLRQ
ncbi:MAG TPA: GxxExxY protein [Gemmatimonadaceae bacterium]|nr:GxxExxY protein [Gemmatimonadaceae bacterium]